MGFFVCAGVICSTLFLSQFLRTTLAKTLQAGLVLDLLLEAIATFELCAVSFEQGLFFEFYGKLVFATVLFCVCLWRSHNWTNVSTAPYMHLERWVDGQIPAVTMLLFIAVELLSGSLVYHYFARSIWSLEMSDFHVQKFNSTEPCSTNVQTSALSAAFIEAICTFAGGFSFQYISTLKGVSNQVGAVIKSLIITGLVMAAFDTSGGYMSPVLASVLQYGCSGITVFEHVLVYWVGASLGAMCAYYAWKLVQGSSTGAVKERTD